MRVWTAGWKKAIKLAIRLLQGKGVFRTCIQGIFSLVIFFFLRNFFHQTFFHKLQKSRLFSGRSMSAIWSIHVFGCDFASIRRQEPQLSSSNGKEKVVDRQKWSHWCSFASDNWPFSSSDDPISQLPSFVLEKVLSDLFAYQPTIISWLDALRIFFLFF